MLLTFLPNLAPTRQLCSPFGQNLRGSCVGNELAVHAVCLGVSLGTLLGCIKPAGHVLLWYKGLKWVQQICVTFEFQDILSCVQKTLSELS